jgi:hypothetical protein
MRDRALVLAIGVPVSLMLAGAAAVAIEVNHYYQLGRIAEGDGPNADIVPDKRGADYAQLGLTREDILGLANPDLPGLPEIPVDPEDPAGNETYRVAKASSPNEGPALVSAYEADPKSMHVTPEPSTVGMVGLGCLGLGLFGSHGRATRRRTL